ncbi:MAG: type II and III secretion system protein family protein [Fimbriiglobus sp.]
MRRTTLTRLRLLASLALVAGVLGGTATAQPPVPPTLAVVPAAEAKVDPITGALIAPLGNLVKFDPKAGAITGVTVANEEIVFAIPDLQNPKLLALTARKEGLTKITLTFADKGRPPLTIDVIVQPDYEFLRKILKQSVPTANVTVTPGPGGTIVLGGYVNRAEDADIVLKIASASVGGNVANVISNLQIGGAQHVLIDVVIAQVDRTEARDRGVNFGIQGTSVQFTSLLGGLAANAAGGVGPGGLGGILPGTGATATVGIVPASTLAVIRALRTEGLAKLISEPKVITQSGRNASLRVGGTQPVIAGVAGFGAVSVEQRDVGMTMEVLPIVFGNGKIYLELNPEFASVNTGSGIAIPGGGFTPGFNRTSIRSSVMMEPGQTYAIGGLIQQSVQAQSQKVPYFGDMPLIGAAFSSVSHEERETELVILVTPRLVDAMDCNQLPKRVPGKETRSPDDYELFLESLIEAPRGQRRPWTNGTYNAAYKNDRSYGMFPCIGADGRPLPGCSPTATLAAPVGVTAGVTSAAPAAYTVPHLQVVPVTATTEAPAPVVETPALPSTSER